MDYFAGLDISMDETHVCVLDREGEVVRESKTVSTAGRLSAGQRADRAHVFMGRRCLRARTRPGPSVLLSPSPSTMNFILHRRITRTTG